MALMEIDQIANIDVAQSVAICQQKRIVIGQIPRHALQTPARHGLETRIRQRDRKILLLMRSHEFNLRLPSQRNPEVIVHGFIIQEVILDHVAAIAQAENELPHPVVRIHFHDVPQDRPPSDLHHRLGTEFRLLAKASAQSTAQYDNFHIPVLKAFSGIRPATSRRGASCFLGCACVRW